MFNTNKKLKNKHLYYCYDLELAKHLRDECKFPYICHALSKDIKKEFYLFIKSPALNKRIKQFENYTITK